MVLPERKTIRLKDYDYSQDGCYFITICTHERKNLLCGDVQKYTDVTIQIENSLFDIASMYRNVYLDQHIIMPNHLHAIIVLNKMCLQIPLTGGQKDLPLQEIIRRFKSFTTYQYNKSNNTKGKILWQRGYYDHIIRNEKELQEIRKYIIENPVKWKEDQYYI